MTYGYIRVSSDKQTVKNQRFEINAYISSKKVKAETVFVSGKECLTA